MSCCWTGRGGNSAPTSAGQFRSTWPQSWSGWGSIDQTGWKRCAASVDCSSRRRGDQARSSMPQRAARGAGSRARRRLEPPLCRPLARRRAVTDISITLSLEEHGRLARSTRCPAPSRQGERFNFSRQAITHTRPSSRYARSQTASRLRSGCAGRLLRPTKLWVSEFTDRQNCGCLSSLARVDVTGGRGRTASPIDRNSFGRTIPA